jgi:hypothetical protein
MEFGSTIEFLFGGYMLQIDPLQFAEIDKNLKDHLARLTLLDFLNDISSVDFKTYELLRLYASSDDLSVFHRITEMTNIAAYQRAMVCLFLETRRDVTVDENFSYLMSNSFLSGNAKARHVILAANAALAGQ